MVRLNMTRDQKVRKRGLVGMTSQLNNITRFGDITGLIGGEGPVCLRKMFPCTLGFVILLRLFFVLFCFTHLCLLFNVGDGKTKSQKEEIDEKENKEKGYVECTL